MPTLRYAKIYYMKVEPQLTIPSLDCIQDSSIMDPAMDELIDLLSYDCPFTGKKRTAGHYLDNQNLQCLGMNAAGTLIRTVKT